jgi:hypothetical protein
MAPKVFRVAVAYRLGVQVVPLGISCPRCMQTIDVLGDHASCCSRNGDLIVRHHRIRNLVGKFCEEALLSPVLEKQNILGESDGRRPGDVTLKLWRNNKGLAIDVAVTSPFSSSGLKAKDPAESYSQNVKHKRYDEGFEGSDFFFCPLVLETTGGINSEGTSALKQIFRFGSRRLNLTHSVYAGRGWARLSCNLQSSVAQAILTRTCG